MSSAERSEFGQGHPFQGERVDDDDDARRFNDDDDEGNNALFSSFKSS